MRRISRPDLWLVKSAFHVRLVIWTIEKHISSYLTFLHFPPDPFKTLIKQHLNYHTQEVMFEKCFITTAGMIETTRATNVYHKYLSQMWENVQHHDDTDTLSQYHENGKFPKTWQLLVLTFFYKSTRTSSPNHDYRSTSKWKCALSEVKVLFLPATKLMIVSLSLSIVNIGKKSLSFSQIQNKDSSVARTSSHLVTSAVPAHL